MPPKVALEAHTIGQSQLSDLLDLQTELLLEFDEERRAANTREAALRCEANTVAEKLRLRHEAELEEKQSL